MQKKKKSPIRRRELRGERDGWTDEEGGKGAQGRVEGGVILPPRLAPTSRREILQVPHEHSGKDTNRHKFTVQTHRHTMSRHVKRLL